MAASIQSPEIRFADFVESLHEPGKPFLSPAKVGETLHLQVQGLAERAHVHRNTVTRAPDSEAVQAYLRKVVRVLSAAFQVNGGDFVRTIAWFKNQPIAELRHKTADELVTEDKADAVVAYIESIASGYVG